MNAAADKIPEIASRIYIMVYSYYRNLFSISGSFIVLSIILLNIPE